VVATDLVSGTPAVLDQGSLGDACLASATLPGIFPPVRRGAMLLVDGGLLQNVPAPVMKSRGADLVIAVDLSSEREGAFDAASTPRLVPILMRSLELLMQNAVSGHAWAFDIRIRPQVGDFRMLSWKNYVELVERGRLAAEAALPEVEREVGALRARVIEAVDRATERATPLEIASARTLER